MPDFTPLALAIGHATDEAGGTGVTIVRGTDGPFRASAATIGRATGTREMHPLTPGHIVDRVDAILLTGGSAYGLDATAGAMRWFEERGRGHPVGAGVVPIVPAAVIFDLLPCGRFDARPTPAMVYEACERAASRDVAEGSVGAGTGATVGKGAGLQYAMKGGVGCAVRASSNVTVGAIAVVNALGDVRGADGAILAGGRDPDGRFVDIARRIAGGAVPQRRFADLQSRNTTLAVVATSALLTRVQLRGLAAAAGAALHRRITPSGTSFDGDVIFAVGPLEGATASPLHVEGLAALALEEAIERAVRLARGRDGIPGLAEEAAT
ncbi:MAG TPA: P1 family peptidase [Gemmatimonadaceae bacterium]|nr:P1 family peptidase [Gemmatimonadaceae bacterium]